MENSSCKLIPLQNPVELRLFDGSVAPNGPIRFYVDLDFILPGGDLDRFRFLVTRLDSTCSLVLGHDWLEARDPDIHWSTGRLKLRSALLPVPSPAPLAPSPAPSAQLTIARKVADFSKSETSSTSIPPSPVAPLLSTSAGPMKTKIDIQVVSAQEFAAFAHTSPELVGSIIAFPPEVAARSSTVEENSSDETIPEHIPSCYHDFADVFSKAKADELPP